MIASAKPPLRDGVIIVTSGVPPQAIALETYVGSEHVLGGRNDFEVAVLDRNVRTIPHRKRPLQAGPLCSSGGLRNRGGIGVVGTSEPLNCGIGMSRSSKHWNSSAAISRLDSGASPRTILNRSGLRSRASSTTIVGKPRVIQVRAWACSTRAPQQSHVLSNSPSPGIKSPSRFRRDFHLLQTMNAKLSKVEHSNRPRKPVKLDSRSCNRRLEPCMKVNARTR